MLLYIHIPFCDSKCHYCAFNSFTRNHHKVDDYFIALSQQLSTSLTLLGNRKFKSVYIGGGTPSAVAAAKYGPLFEMIDALLTDECEITAEANPNSATREWLETMAGFGVNRMSFGVQSFNRKKLNYLNRAHSAKQAMEAVEYAWSSGIENISIDLIYGTQCDSLALLEHDILQAVSLPVTHISAYALTIEPSTYFAAHHTLSHDNETLARFVCNAIIEQGFPQYEISSFGKQKSIHNLGYWEHNEYLGVGCGAVGYQQQARYYPSSDLQQYIDAPLSSEIETLSSEDITFEKLFLGLRSCIGVDVGMFDAFQREKVEALSAENKVKVYQNRVYNRDYLLSDEIALYLSKT